jgi:hypothetical protein
MTSERTDEERQTATGATAGTATAERQSLFEASQAATYSTRWEEIQSRFVDEPEDSVRKADELVNEVIQDLVAGFRSERETLEREWSAKGEASTEDFRVALQRYRSFFQRLLSQ